jgi:uncharacterized protein with von Willebrand factor type A (vWA) domain
MDAPADASFARHVATFGRILRESGLPVGPTRLLNALHALDVTGVGSRDDVYWALRGTLVSDHRDIEAFDVAFGAFWERLVARPAAARPTQEPQAAQEETDENPGPGASDGTMDRAVDQLSADADSDTEDDQERPDGDSPGAGWSASERLQSLDFSEYGDEDLRQASAALADLARRLPMRRSRRMRPAPSGVHLDARRTLQESMRTEGHPLERSWRRHKHVPRKLVFLLDVSGSMRAYARPLLVFAAFMVRAAPKVEVFSFGTRLTRLTPALSRLRPVEALESTGRLIPDWSGGTRIGDSLRAFNDLAARTAMTRGAAVVILSDGWERGDVSLLRGEMARLHRLSHNVVWVNPTAGDPDFQPLVGGMAAALPSIDLFLPGHNLRSVTELADVLAALPNRRHGARSVTGPVLTNAARRRGSTSGLRPG